MRYNYNHIPFNNLVKAYDRMLKQEFIGIKENGTYLVK